MNHLSIVRDDIKREICGRCEFLGEVISENKICARSGEAMVAMVIKNFSQNPEVVAASPDEEVTVQLGEGVNTVSTKADLIDSLLTAQDRLAAEADRCTSARSLAFMRGDIDEFEPKFSYSQDELMASVSSDI